MPDDLPEDDEAALVLMDEDFRQGALGPLGSYWHVRVAETYWPRLRKMLLAERHENERLRTALDDLRQIATGRSSNGGSDGGRLVAIEALAGAALSPQEGQ